MIYLNQLLLIKKGAAGDEAGAGGEALQQTKRGGQAGVCQVGGPAEAIKERRQYVEHTAAVSLCSFVQVKDKPEPLTS